MTEQTYETDTFNRYIPLSEAAAVFQLLNELHDQIKKKPLSELPYYELEDEVCIDDVDTIKAYMEEHPDFFIDAPLFINRTTLFLIACEDGMNADVIEFLLNNNAEINRCNILGYNAVMLVIRNENMDIDTKLDVIQMLIDRGIDINWVNCYAETALNIALSRIEPRIAKLLMDNGCVLTIPEPTRQQYKSIGFLAFL